MLCFIIPAYNEELLIARTIQNIHHAARLALGENLPAFDPALKERDAMFTGMPYEIIVADDASTDRTAEIAASNGARVIAVSNRQIAATRNAGARAAMGDQFIFVDADTIVSEGAVRGAHHAMTSVARGGTGAAGGGCALRFDGPIPRRPWPLRIALPIMMFLARTMGVASGCFIFCTRDVFERTGGFDETLYAGEEVAMSRAIRRCGKFRFHQRPQARGNDIRPQAARAFGTRNLRPSAPHGTARQEVPHLARKR